MTIKGDLEGISFICMTIVLFSYKAVPINACLTTIIQLTTSTPLRHFYIMFYITFAKVGLPTYGGMQFQSLKAYQHHAHSLSILSLTALISVIRTVVHSLSFV